MGLGFAPCQSPCPRVPGVQKGENCDNTRKTEWHQSGYLGTTDGTVFRAFLGKHRLEKPVHGGVGRGTRAQLSGSFEKLKFRLFALTRCGWMNIWIVVHVRPGGLVSWNPQFWKMPSQPSLRGSLRQARPVLSAAVAREILNWSFNQDDRDRMSMLADKARTGGLTPPEAEELDAYERVNSFLGLVKSKARRSLQQSSVE